MGGPAQRGIQALKAGCDMLLVCNKRDAQVEVLDNLPITSVPLADALLKKQNFTLSELKLSQEWKDATEAMKRLSLVSHVNLEYWFTWGIRKLSKTPILSRSALHFGFFFACKFKFTLNVFYCVRLYFFYSLLSCR